MDTKTSRNFKTNKRIPEELIGILLLRVLDSENVQ